MQIHGDKLGGGSLVCPESTKILILITSGTTSRISHDENNKEQENFAPRFRDISIR